MTPAANARLPARAAVFWKRGTNTNNACSREKVKKKRWDGGRENVSAIMVRGAPSANSRAVTYANGCREPRASTKAKGFCQCVLIHYVFELMVWYRYSGKKSDCGEQPKLNLVKTSLLRWINLRFNGIASGLKRPYLRMEYPHCLQWRKACS